MSDPLWLNAVTGVPEYDATELRQAMALPLTYGGAQNLGARSGVRPGGTQLETSLAGSLITVQEGVACLYASTPSASRAPYWVCLPIDETHSLTAADATNPRKDIVILRVYDDDQDLSGLRLARSEYLTGTPAPSPSEPAVPSGAFRLATIDVPQSGGGSPAVTMNHPFTVASGGIVPVRNSTEEAALTLYNGLTWVRLDLNELRIRLGGVTRLVSLDSPVLQAFTSGGIWTKPAGARLVRVREVGGGASGGGIPSTVVGNSSEGGGGGGGEYAEGLFAASALGATETVTIGAGGAGASAGADGNNGGTSSFGSHITALGGSAGQGGVSSIASSHRLGGAGGTGGTGGSVRVPGDDGGPGISMNGADSAPFPLRACFGGGTVLGAIATPPATPSTGRAGRQRGGGSTGAGRFSNGATLGTLAGAGGIVIVETYF